MKIKIRILIEPTLHLLTIKMEAFKPCLNLLHHHLRIVETMIQILIKKKLYLQIFRNIII
jgi:hypothetical protein